MYFTLKYTPNSKPSFKANSSSAYLYDYLLQQ